MIEFAEALAKTDGTRRYLLLGNGFSISVFPERFSYASLFEEAQTAGLFNHQPELSAAFELLGTTDFELVMETLKNASKLAPLYGSNQPKMVEHAELLKTVLVQAIAGRHPERPNELNDVQYERCRAFLANFIGQNLNKRGRVFTLNYDLLLYWAVLHDIFKVDWAKGTFNLEADQELEHDDGFRALEDDFDAEYVAWDQFEASNDQTITFLHGALHLYERGPELAKLCWERAGNKPLMDQIREALDEERYPLFVSEGSSAKKLARINRSAYLSKGLRSFSGCCKTKAASLFVIGHSLAMNDDHVIRRIRNGKIERMFVSIFGDPENAANLTIRAKANSIVNQRQDKYPLEVEFVDAATLNIWN